MKLFAVSLYFETPWMIDTKTGSGIVALPAHMTTNILSDDNQFGALMKATMIHKDKGQHQWHSVAEIEPAESPKQSVGQVELATIRDVIAKDDHEWENGEADDVDYNGDAIQDIYTYEAKAVIAHLTTTQSAPEKEI